MKLRHATPASNLPSIRKRGLLTAKSQGKLPIVWLHTSSRSVWAILHTLRRHHTTNIVILECSVPRSWLTRSRAGLWYSNRDVPADRIIGTVAVEDYPCSPPTIFHSSSARLCFAPGRTFTSLREATAFAIEAAHWNVA